MWGCSYPTFAAESAPFNCSRRWPGGPGAVHAAGEDLAQLVAAAALTGGEAVLDAGSGAGHTALAVAPHAATVVSVDLSAAMLAQGQRLATERGITNTVFVVGDVEAGVAFL